MKWLFILGVGFIVQGTAEIAPVSLFRIAVVILGAFLLWVYDDESKNR